MTLDEDFHTLELAQQAGPESAKGASQRAGVPAVLALRAAPPFGVAQAVGRGSP
jgi:hypothetical protein